MASLKKRNKNKISFDDEIVTKNSASEILSNFKENDSKSKPQKMIVEDEKQHKQKPKKRKKDKNNESDAAAAVSKKSKNVTVPEPSETETLNSNDNPTEATTKVDDKKTESIRSIKKKKHAKLVEEKKLKVELSNQQKALNYLSKWKHSRTEWKFEKLKQIWLTQNLYDSSKLPNEFWDITLQYFNGSQGHTRKSVLDEAINIIDNEELENNDDDYKTKLRRARDIVQCLQE